MRLWIGNSLHHGNFLTKTSGLWFDAFDLQLHYYHSLMLSMSLSLSKQLTSKMKPDRHNISSNDQEQEEWCHPWTFQKDFLHVCFGPFSWTTSIFYFWSRSLNNKMTNGKHHACNPAMKGCWTENKLNLWQLLPLILIVWGDTIVCVTASTTTAMEGFFRQFGLKLPDVTHIVNQEESTNVIVLFFIMKTLSQTTFCFKVWADLIRNSC